MNGKKIVNDLRKMITVAIAILIIINFIFFPASVFSGIVYTCALPLLIVAVACDVLLKDYKVVIFHVIWLVFCFLNVLKF
ncbi:MAG: hypothetical protein HFJ52_02320 [Clostridia bacterium]|nr:hypothetical protein [Clostridia bacterium]